MIKILDIPINQINYITTLKKIKKIIDSKTKAYICVAATHLIVECQYNPKLLLGVQKANLVTPDGIPLVWISKLYGSKNISRVYGPNLTLMLCELSQKNNYKVFLLGGHTGQSEELKIKLLKKFPKLKIVGNVDTPQRPIPEDKNIIIIEKINKVKPDIVLVGLGCPNQELWMINNREKLSAPLLIGVGAAFDFINGNIKQAPVWMQNNGFEWLFRLIQEPRRLFKRYFLLNIIFIIKISRQIIIDTYHGKI